MNSVVHGSRQPTSSRPSTCSLRFASTPFADRARTSPRGGPLRLTNFRRSVWHPAVRAAGLEGLTIHGLRHTAASLYISAGTPPKVVQRILGHASITITMDLYGHLYSDEMDTWAQRLDEAAKRIEVWPKCGQNQDQNGSGPRLDRGAGL